MGPGKTIYLSHVREYYFEFPDDLTFSTKVAVMRAGEARPVAAMAKRAATAASDLYATAEAFLLENREFQYIWVSAACLPPPMKDQKWRGAVPSATGFDLFEQLHPGALLACDAVLVAPPERERLIYEAEMMERYTDLEAYR